MKKFLFLILSLSFIAASCDVNGLLSGQGGIRGILKSEDAGETFHSANLLKVKGSLDTLTVNALALDQRSPDILYIGSSSGIYKSEDAAKSWRYILSGMTVADITVDPQDSNVIYAAGIVGQNGKVVKSLDAGVSWVDIYTEPSSKNTVLSVGVSPNNHSLVLAGLTSGELIRSTDGGHTWQSSADFGDRVMKIKFTSNSAIYALTFHKGVQKSNDEGVTWNSITNVLAGEILGSKTQQISSVTSFYDLALDRWQTGVLYLGTEQGLFRTVDEGVTWSFLGLPLKNSSLRVSSVGVNSSNSNNLLVGVGSTIFKSVNGGVTWETKVLPTQAEVRSIIINPQSNNLIYLGMGTRR